MRGGMFERFSYKVLMDLRILAGLGKVCPVGCDERLAYVDDRIVLVLSTMWRLWSVMMDREIILYSNADSI
jgi:hypothetical protein